MSADTWTKRQQFHSSGKESLVRDSVKRGTRVKIRGEAEESAVGLWVWTARPDGGWSARQVL